MCKQMQMLIQYVYMIFARVSSCIQRHFLFLDLQELQAMSFVDLVSVHFSANLMGRGKVLHSANMLKSFFQDCF